MLTPQLRLTGLDGKIIVDLFAGGGGMSVAMEMAWGRSPDVAINHNDDALSMHRLNHPQTRHFIADVWEVCPHAATQGRPVGWLHLSPDCTHHSQARGGQPRSGKIRALAWVGYRWAGQTLPDVISLENVKQFLKWGPLVAKRDRATGRVVTLDMVRDRSTGRMTHRIACPGERVPVQNQYLVPDKKREGQTYQRFVRSLERLGYRVEVRTLRAADCGGHTTRERLFVVARRDGRAVQWSDQANHKEPAPHQSPWRAAADCIDWSIQSVSIFARPRELAGPTLRRIARGVMKYVLSARAPFIISARNGERARQRPRIRSVDDPVWAVTSKGSQHAAVTPVLEMAYMMQANGGFNETPGHDLRDPMSTITNTGSQQQLITAHLVNAPGDKTGWDGSPWAERADKVVALLMNCYPEDELPIRRTRSGQRYIEVMANSRAYALVDIGLRMLEPRELYRAQDFPDTYIIDRGHDGRRFSKAKQVRMVGNSVNPLMAVGFLRLNAPHLAIGKAAA